MFSRFVCILVAVVESKEEKSEREYSIYLNTNEIYLAPRPNRGPRK
jgi:hypothetical protein